ncbi:MAG: DUF5110 domain-containing protein [Spirochaetaceae bacterium]|nr:MAG: DUF5110 domain-containing protein [Spirochaetaceae bacterium]
MNEPSVFNARLTLANNVLHRVGEKKQIRDHCTIHNLYALLMARATAEGLRKLRAGMRQFVFSRAAYAGMQRWASTWTGDNRSNWGHLRLSIPMILNLGMSGMPMTGPDIGGFWDAPTKELLARWFAAGVLYPFHRNHTQNGSPPQEIWSFGPEIEEICARFIRMRYAFIPYLYALFFVAWKNGWPIMRPLVFHFPMDPKCYEDMFADTEYMAGDSVLVAPILWQGKSERCIYLPCEKNNDDINPASIPGLVIKPALVEWVCHRTHRIFSGGMKITEKVPLDEVPLFVRRGSVLPMSPGIMTTAQAFSQEIVLDVYPAKTLDGVIYLDDNQTEEYQDGKYSLFKISGKTDDKSMELQVRRAEGSLSPAWARINTIIVRIACYGQKHDMRQIKVDGKLLSDQAFLIKDDWLCFKFSDFGPDLKIEADWS